MAMAMINVPVISVELHQAPSRTFDACEKNWARPASFIFTQKLGGSCIKIHMASPPAALPSSGKPRKVHGMSTLIHSFRQVLRRPRKRRTSKKRRIQLLRRQLSPTSVAANEIVKTALPRLLCVISMEIMMFLELRNVPRQKTRRVPQRK